MKVSMIEFEVNLNGMIFLSQGGLVNVNVHSETAMRFQFEISVWLLGHVLGTPGYVHIAWILKASNNWLLLTLYFDMTESYRL